MRNRLLYTALALVQMTLALPAVAEEKPLAPWAVHTLVSEGATTLEGEKFRAVLKYGETGGPTLEIELIKVEMGYPSQSSVLWQISVDPLGDTPDPCPIAEMYCATLRNIRWMQGNLEYDFVAPSKVYRCRISGIRSRSSKTSCSPT